MKTNFLFFLLLLLTMLVATSVVAHDAFNNETVMQTDVENPESTDVQIATSSDGIVIPTTGQPLETQYVNEASSPDVASSINAVCEHLTNTIEGGSSRYHLLCFSEQSLDEYTHIANSEYAISNQRNPVFRWVI